MYLKVYSPSPVLLSEYSITVKDETIFKYIYIYIYIYLFLAIQSGMWDLSSPNHTPCIESVDS